MMNMEENDIWYSQEMLDMMNDFDKKLKLEFYKSLFENKIRVPKEDDNVKLAMVNISGKKEMIGVDKITLKGYKLDSQTPTWALPLQEQKYDSFERWATTFDV